LGGKAIRIDFKIPATITSITPALSLPQMILNKLTNPSTPIPANKILLFLSSLVFTINAAVL
jgi:hypothetical protein